MRVLRGVVYKINSRGPGNITDAEHNKSNSSVLLPSYSLTILFRVASCVMAHSDPSCLKLSNISSKV